MFISLFVTPSGIIFDGVGDDENRLKEASSQLLLKFPDLDVKLRTVEVPDLYFPRFKSIIRKHERKVNRDQA